MAGAVRSVESDLVPPVIGGTDLSHVAVSSSASAGSNRPLVVELVGPAGAGKTALFSALKSDPRVRTGIRIHRGRQALELAGTAMALAPAALRLLPQGPRALWNGLLHLVRLQTLPSVLASAMDEDGGHLILLDEGPVFSLGRLSVFQRASQGSGLLARQWRAELARWSTILDAVIWIDAPNRVLAARIRSRAKAHRVKHASDVDVADFLDRYRRAYLDILVALRATGRAHVLELTTAEGSVAAAVARLLAKLEQLGLPKLI